MYSRDIKKPANKYKKLMIRREKRRLIISLPKVDPEQRPRMQFS